MLRTLQIVFLMIGVLLISSRCRQSTTLESSDDLSGAIAVDTFSQQTTPPQTEENAAESMQNPKHRVEVENVSVEPVEYNEVVQGDEDVAEVVTVVYPRVRAADPLLEKYVNDTIQAKIRDTFGDRVFSTTQVQQKKLEENSSLLEDPFEHNLDYTLSFASNRFLGITFIESTSACCGASGSGHWSYTISFDLVKRKVLVVKDIIKPHKLHTLQEIILDHARKDDQLTSLSLEELKALIGNVDKQAFELRKSGIGLFFRNTGGSWSSFIEVEIKFNEYPDLFEEAFLAAVREK